MKETIPNYRLYGKTDTDLSCEPVHVDDVSISSPKSDWYIEPHRHDDLIHAIFFRGGEGTMRLEEERHQFVSPVLIMIPPAAVHSFRVSTDLAGELVTVTSDYMNRLFSPSPGIKPDIYTACLIQGEEHQSFLAEIEIFFARLKTEYAERQLARNLLLQSLLGELFCKVLRYRQRSNQEEGFWGLEDRNQWYFRQFQNLIGHRLSEKITVPQYAAKLRISATHLNRICREVANRSALDVIHDRMVNEAKRSLVYTMLSVSEVGYQLGFEDPGYFSRFFKKQTGLSPKQYKSRIQQRI
ncbi:MAG: helix-turn-helix domain-containing protein [Halopseudomonas sp.]